MPPTPLVRDALAAAIRQLGSRTDAERLLMHALGVGRAWLFAHATDAMPADAAERFAALVQRRARGEPVAYIVGRQGFWSLDLAVTPATLIPRPETELLVEQALGCLPPGATTTVADLGTGSGAIALALAHERPRSHVVAVDRSIEALRVAQINAVRLGFGNIDFVQGSWCEPLHAGRFDVMVSNPPYIETGDPHLQQGDLRFEPVIALASGRDGLQAIRALVLQAPACLVPGGALWLEHGWTQGPAVRTVLLDAGFVEVRTVLDLERRERVSGGRWPAR